MKLNTKKLPSCHLHAFANVAHQTSSSVISVDKVNFHIIDPVSVHCQLETLKGYSTPK